MVEKNLNVPGRVGWDFVVNNLQNPEATQAFFNKSTDVIFFFSLAKA